MFSPKFAFILAAILRGASAASDLSNFESTIDTSCVSAPDDACAVLVGTCVADITSGRISAPVFMNDHACAAAATCAGVDSVIDAACCTGTCLHSTDVGDMNFDDVLHRDPKDEVDDECNPSCPYDDQGMCVEAKSERDVQVYMAETTTLTGDEIASGEAIVPDKCRGSVETPTILPTLRYYCNLLPNICANIRAHPDFSGNSIVLTYDPFRSSCGKRRNEVCTRAVKNRFQEAGKCDKKQHNPAYWKVSCDEFPFNSSLEGGARNARVMAVPTREQQYQGTLQASVVYLRSISTDRTSIWRRPAQCHRYRLELLNAPESGAPLQAVGSLNSGSAFFTSGRGGKRFIENHLAEPIPPPTRTDEAYPSTATNVHVPGNSRGFDCYNNGRGVSELRSHPVI